MKPLFATLLILFFLLPLAGKSQTGKDPVDHVNPYMGNISHLLVPTFPTVHLPNSMLRVYPERGDFTGDLLKGLPLVVTSHRGKSAFNLSPFQGSDKALQPVLNYSYDLEKIRPYSYSVYLDDQQTTIEYAVSHQAAIYSMEFAKTEPVSLIVNSKDGELKWNGTAISGYQQLENNTRVFIYLEPETKPAKQVALVNNQIKEEQSTAKGRNACLVLKYPENTGSVKIRYGISFISEEQAAKNLKREISHFDLQKIAQNGREIWNKALQKTSVSGGTPDELSVFYTSVYRTYERPVCISEDGKYFSAFDHKIHNDEGKPFFTDDWIWDTYRATHPLRVITEPEMEQNIIHSFLRMSEQMENFWWPTFPEITGDSRRMNSNHGVATVIDAYKKGIKGFDLAKVYEACKKGITEKTLAPWSGKPAGELDKFYKEHGYIPALNEGATETIAEVHHFERRQPVAVTLGTAYDEWCLAQIAKELGNTNDFEYFQKRSLNYRNLFYPETQFFHPKDKDGKFIQPFDYVFSGGQGARGFYGENNAWIYRWDVQHNIADLIKLMNGNQNFIKNLDDMFSQPLGKGKFDFYAQLPDHTGNVGQFSMANEPSLHIPYLYNYAGQPWKTQKRIRTLLNQWFRNDLMGVPGDEDGGGMSAFVAFSLMGFYPVTPGLPIYNIGSPAFRESVVQLANGKKFKIVAENAGPENKYIQSAKLNGVNWEKPWFSHDDLKNGGELYLIMGSKANKEWGAKPENAPPSFRYN